MITPEYLSDIMATVEEKLVDVDNYLIRRIIKRIMDTFESDEFADLLIPSTKSDIRKLLKAGVLYEDVQQAVEKALPDIAGAVREAFYASAVEITRQNIEIAKKIVELEGLSVNVPEYEQAGIPQKASELGMTKYEIRQLEAAYRRTNGEIKNLTRTTASKAQEAYINACDMAYMKVKQGVSVQTAVIEAIKDVADSGAQCVTYGGKKENIEVAVARAVRTGVNQANGDIVLTRCAEMGVQYVKTSWHMGARVTKAGDYTSHDTWQGKVFHINWDTPDMQEFAEAAGVEEPGYEWIEQMRKSMKEDKKLKYDDFIEKTGYGDILGLCGINCRHSFYPFYPGIQLNDDERPDLKENEKRFRLDQKQRAMERNMRKTRRELAGLEAAKKDTEEFRAEKRAVREKLKKQSDKYFDFCNDNGLKPRNMAFKIGGNITKKTAGALNNINDPLGEKREKHAIQYYKSLENRDANSVAIKIAQNAEIDFEDAKDIYNHVFINKHKFEDGRIEKFYPDYDMAQSFQRILEGKDIKNHDITMLNHEKLEFDTMREYDMVYEEAHKIAESKYNYSKELKEFLKESD